MDNYSDYKIVEYRPIYQQQVIEIIGRLLQDLNVIPKSDEPLDDEDLYKIPEVYSGKGRFWVAIKGDKVIGTVSIRDMGNSVAKLNRMFVSTDYHGTGVGKSLLDHAIKFAKKKNFKKIILNTHLNMTRAHKFYEKNGFIRVAEDSDKYHYQLDLI